MLNFYSPRNTDWSPVKNETLFVKATYNAVYAGRSKQNAHSPDLWYAIWYLSTIEPELMNILLIDDDPEFLYLLNDLINNKGFTAYTASNGIKALELMTEHKIDLVITDAIMPDTPIMSFICTLKNDYPHVPLILISGLPSNPLINNSLILGADEFIPKPLDTSNLFSAINKYKAA